MATEDQQNLSTLRLINNHSSIEIEHSNIEQPVTTAHQHNDNACGHNHQSPTDAQNVLPNRHAHRMVGRKNYIIICYTVFTCLSCLYLQTQCLNLLINDIKANLMSYVAYFDVIMCLWSYYQTIVTETHVKKLKIKDSSPSLADLRQCTECNYWKPARVSHCSTCGKCIYKLDHHCMWTQTCIGYCNQRSFYLFTVYMTIGVIQFWYSTIRAFVLMSGSCHFFDFFEPAVYVLWAITCFSAGCVGVMIVGLSIGHSLMISTNFTTLDSIKTRRACPIPFCEFRQYQKESPNINEWDRGEIQNLKLIFGSNILTCWLPFARQIENEFWFQPTAPAADSEQQQKRPLSASVSQIRRELKGQLIQVGQRVIQL